MEYNRKFSYPLICSVCGDIARGVNFAAITCMSCKMFFRRHAQSSLNKTKCHFNGNCQMTKNTRKFCLSCRLKQCFKVGMDPQLIRYSSQQKHRLPKLNSTNHLNLNDHSLLTINEWNLLTNINNTYNEQNFYFHVKTFLENQFALPPKIRTKTSNTLNHIGSLFFTIQTFIDRCPFFNSLPINIRKQLIQRNLSTIGSLNGFFLAKQMNIFKNEIYSKFIDNIYGHNYSYNVISASQRLDENEILIKIMFMILIFSSNSTIVKKDANENIEIICHIKIVIYLQDIFITLLWKYLIYQYGHHRAVLKFFSLVKSVLDLMQRMDNGSNIDKHWNMVGNVIEQRTNLLEDEH